MIPRTAAGPEPQSEWTYTIYVRDAQGNTMATYERSFSACGEIDWKEQISLQEQYIYGSARLGLQHVLENVSRCFQVNDPAVLQDGYQLFTNPDYESSTLVYSEDKTNFDLLPFEKSVILVSMKTYEFSDHLGNVSATISDRKITIAVSAGNAVASYSPEILSQQDYFPFSAALSICDSEWLAMRTLSEVVMDVALPLVLTINLDKRVEVGMGMMGRSVTAEGYRYGYNGMEKESDTFEGAYDFGARILDTRLGRWLSVDPLCAKYSSLSVYNFVANSPILCLDPDGKKILVYTQNGTWYEYKPGVEPTTSDVNVLKVHEAITYSMNADMGNNIWTAMSDSEFVAEIKPKMNATNKFDPLTGNDLGKEQRTYDMEDGTTLEGEYVGTITWDYNTPMEVSTQQYADDIFNGLVKGEISPTTILIHEAGHWLERMRVVATGDLAQIKDYNDSTQPNGSEYTSAEEKRNITSVETPYIQQINKWELDNNGASAPLQPIRYNHSGTGTYRDPKHPKVFVKDVNSPNKVGDPSTYETWKKNRSTEYPLNEVPAQ